MVRRLPAKHNPYRSIEELSVAFTVGEEVGDVRNISVQVKDANGNNLTEPVSLTAYLSDDADGSSVTSSAPDTVAIGTDGLAIPLVADKVFQLVTEDDGHLDLDITEDGSATWYLVVVLPNGKLAISNEITLGTTTTTTTTTTVP